MTDKRISELTSASSLGDADVFPIVQSGETKKLTGSAVKSYAQSGVVLASEKGANSGVATLGSDGKLTASQLPDLAVSDYLGSVANQTAMLALTGQKGDWCTRSDLGTTWVISGVNPSLITGWTELSYPTAPVTSVAGKTGAVSLVKGDVGLGNVDNTSDANKPISSATQTALDGKQTKITASGITKGDGNGGITAATAGTDYLAPAAVGATIVAQTGANGSALLPAGTTAQRPASPAAGHIRYNATTGKFEGYGSAWGNIGGGAFIGDTAPANPGAGDLWWNSATGHTFVFYGSAWVDLFGGAEGQYLPLTGGTISGNLALGVTPSGWGSGYKALQANRLVFQGDPSNGGVVGVNAYYDGSAWRYINTDYASLYRQSGGQSQWYTAPSGTAGNAISFTQAMTLDASGNLGIGTTSPSSKLTVNGSSGALAINLANVGGYGTLGTFGIVNIGVNNDTYIGSISNNSLLFYSYGTERARIDSSGNLLVGKTVADDSTTGFRVAAGNSYMSMARASAAPCYFNRTGTDGGVVEIANDGVIVGTISVSGSSTAYNTSSDQRLKNDLGIATDASVIDNTIVRNFEWKADGSIDRGVFAQEAYLVKPSAVAKGQSEELNEDGTPVHPWGVDYSKYVPDLIVYCQQLSKRLSALEAH